VATDKYRERYAPIGVHETSMYPGTEECLKELKAQGYIIGIASSKPEHFCKVVLEEFGILKYFDDVVGATLDGRIGTKEEVLEEVFRRWSHISKDEICLVGDTIFDVEGANAHQIPCVAVTYGFGNVEEMKSAGAVAFIDTLMELPEILKKF